MTVRSTPRQVEDLLSHASWVKRIATDLVDADLADDLAQDVWVTSIRRAPAALSAPRAWLRAVVMNLVRSGYRSERRRQARENAVSLDAVGAVADTPEELTIRTQLQRRLAEQILSLREPYRQAVLLRYVEGMTAAQIARSLRLPAGTIRRRIKVGLDELRANLGPQPKDRGRRARLLMPVAPASLRLVPPAERARAEAGGGPTLPTGAGGLSRTMVLGAVGALVVLPLFIAAVVHWLPASDSRPPSRPVAAAVSLRAPVFTPQPIEAGSPTTDDISEGVLRLPGSPPQGGAPTAGVEGRVLDTEGNGLSGATVVVWSTHSDRRRQREYSVQAGELGRYRIPLPPGRYVLRASSPGYGKVTSWQDVRNTSVIDLRLHLAAGLVGRVVDAASGQPLPGGTVTVTSRQGGPRTARVDDTGAFSLKVEPGRYRVSARRGALFGVSDAIQARPAENASVEVAVARTAALFGRVSSAEPTAGSGENDEAKGGLGGVAVSVRPLSDRDRLACRGFYAATTSAADGTYRLEGLPPCAIAIGFEAPRHVPRTVGVPDWTGSTDRRLDSRLAAASLLTGQVRDAAGEPVAGADIYVGPAPAGPRLPPRRLRSDEQGNFVLDGLPPGDIWLVAQHDRGTASLGPEHLVPGEERRLSVKLGSPAWISGRVVYADGAPAPGVSLQANATRGEHSFGSHSVAVSGGDGRFTIGPLVAGQILLRPMQTWFAAPRGSAPGLRPLLLSVTEGEQKTDVHLTMVRGDSRLEGMVLDDRGQVVAGATVDVFLQNSDKTAWPFEVRAFTDDAGRFELRDLAAGTRKIRVEHPLHGVSSERLRPEGGPLTIRLKPRDGRNEPMRQHLH